MPESSTLVCTYVDHHTTSPADLASLYLERGGAAERVGSAMLLQTCHRTEWIAPAGIEPPAWFPTASTSLVGGLVLERVARIAAGVNSIVPGDSLVLGQVVRALTATRSGSAVRSLAHRAVQIALEARRRFELRPEVDYADLPRVLGGAAGPIVPGEPCTLLIVGGGVLAQSIVEESRLSYSHAVMVTNDPKRLRRALPAAERPDVAILRPGDLASWDPHSRFDLVVATNRAAGSDARSGLETLSEHPLRRATVDLCALPYLPRIGPNGARRKNHLHIHDEAVLTTVRQANDQVARRAVSAGEWIAEQIRAEPSWREQMAS